ncbi:hypothetical protein F5141DRAFT_495978 [Pisolithus sp. B1]|nr:hypothetical protein F5141DRAFT_495978 [Pisolithus sp. B1]
MFPVLLPPNLFLKLSELYTAYQRCLALEAATSSASHQHCPPPIVCARLLGHLLRLSPPGSGQDQVQREITLAADDMKLKELASSYLSRFICAFKRSGKPTPAPSEHPSHTSSEDVGQYSKALVGEDTLDYRMAQAAAGRRDDNRCMLTGERDYQDGGLVWVEVAHIIPEAANGNIREEGGKHFCSEGVRTVISMFTDANILEELAGNLIHRLENIISMELSCRRAFGELVLWLKPVEGLPHTYRVYEGRHRLKRRMSIPDTVTFSTTTEFPLPHPAYLALHALCCEVGWMSGAVEYILDIERRMDQTSVLANDGSTADVLMGALTLVRRC